MAYDLTEDQKAILRLLVEHVRTDGRRGDDVWITFGPHFTKISDFEGDFPPFSRNYLRIFVNNGLMEYHPYPGNPDQYICTLTKKAKDAVDTDFAAVPTERPRSTTSEYNLTEHQKRILVLLVHGARAGKVDGEELDFKGGNHGSRLLGHQGEFPDVKPSVLEALEDEGLLRLVSYRGGVRWIQGCSDRESLRRG